MSLNFVTSFIVRWKRRKVKVIAVVASLLLLLGILLPQERPVDDVSYDVIEKVGFHKTWRQQSGQMCVHPQLDPFHPSLTHFLHDVPKVQCSAEDNWVDVVNGTFRISKKAKRRYGQIVCEYAPVVRGTSDYSARHLEHIKPMLDGAPISTDFFKVACISSSRKKYFNIHSGIAYNKTLHEKASKKLLSDKGLGLDVLMFGFDSLSRMAWIRTLKKTREYFLRDLKGIELEGYNIVGDGTPQALLPILTGKTEEELPEARRGWKGADFVDGHPWIWKNFSDNGYVTFWAEDMAFIGTFQYRMLGFKEQPTDHNMRTFYLSAERMYSRNKPLCLGSVSRQKNFFNWFRDGCLMYGSKKKFMFGFHSETSHDDNNMVQVVDDDMRDFLHFLESRGYLNRSVLILMSDHGARFSNIRSTAQGKQEERMPYFAFRFPPWFETKYPDVMKNVRTNAHRLTTPFDIHATFHDILNFTGSGLGDVSQRGISILKEIPKERTCKHAGIEPHWCACLAWKEVNQSNLVVQKSVSAALLTINSLTQNHRDKCAFLTLRKISKSVKYSTSSNVLRYKKSSDVDGRVADLSSSIKNDEDFYQVTFCTEPGEGLYEVTVKHSLNTSDISLSEKEISRINRYGDDPHCIQEDYPHLRPYCYCVPSSKR